jgi:hypothetical protein
MNSNLPCSITFSSLSRYLRTLNNSNISIVATDKGTATKKRKLDAVLDADISWVVRRAVNECKSVPRLLYFTEAFQSSSKHSTLHISNGALISLNEEQDEEAEHSLSKSEVQEALTNWLNLLETKEPEGVGMWKDMLDSHLFGIKKDPHSWDVQLEYIILLRSNCTPFTDRIPAWDWENGWTIATSRASKRKENARNHIETELLAQVNQLQSQIQSQSSFRAPQQTSSTFPTKEDGFPKRQLNLGLKSNAAPTKPGTYAGRDKKDLFCIVCGARGIHSFRQCKAPVQANGNPLRLSPLDGGHWKWIGNDLGICYNWNGRNSCSNPSPCTNGSHACSLCQEPSHGAIKCPTL